MKPIGNYELGLRINGKLECVWEFQTEKEREDFERNTMPLPCGQSYEEHNKFRGEYHGKI